MAQFSRAHTKLCEGQGAELIWRDARGRTFIRSGDIGSVDGEGFLKILDRKKDMIISGGFNVFPADVEEIVARHPDVRDVTSELRTLTTNVTTEVWGPSPVVPEPIRPGG